MPYMISAGIHFHWVKRITAETNSSGVLKLVFHGDEVTDEQFNHAEVVVFTDDPAMVERLVTAINLAAMASQEMEGA